MIAGETCCPDKYSQENGSLKSYNSLMRALKILTSHDFFSADGNSACNSCFLVRSPCSDNRKLLQGLSASIRLPCLGQVCSVVPWLLKWVYVLFSAATSSLAAEIALVLSFQQLHRPLAAEESVPCSFQ